MDKASIEQLVAEAVGRETALLQEQIEQLKANQERNLEIIENLKTENKKLWSEVTKLDRNLDDVEQYNRKSSLILGGAFPEGKEGETPGETREVALKVIKEKLRVDMKGGIAACHRLKNKKRVIIKFQDLDDREAVYQSKFDQKGEWAEKVTVHENLTEKRARMITLLEEMRKNRDILNYYTKNGNIMARDSVEKRYGRIQPWYSADEIKSTVQDAPPRSQGPAQAQTRNIFLRSQTLNDIPQGSVARRATNLEEYVCCGSDPPDKEVKEG